VKDLQMSKLSELIRRTARAETTQIGFATTATKPRPTMLLAALVQSSPKAAVVGVADVVLVQGSSNAASRPDGSDAMWGIWLQDGAGDAATVREQGYEFIVFGGNEAPASLLLEEEAGLVMQVQEELPDSLLQALQWLPLDALLVHWDGTLTVRRQLELQRLSGFSRKPLLLSIEGEPQAGELEALREAGVIGIVVDLTKSGGEARLKALRTTIDGLRPRPKRTRAEAPVVSIAPSFVVSRPEPEEPDEDDE
jgi:hypothetical protein